LGSKEKRTNALSGEARKRLRSCIQRIDFGRIVIDVLKKTIIIPEDKLTTFIPYRNSQMWNIYSLIHIIAAFDSMAVLS
jgi:hypothetical protein